MQSYFKNYPVTSRHTNQSVSTTASSKQCRGKWQRGVNLIELMIILIILAILAAIVLPYYGHYVQKARLGESQVLFSGIKTMLGTFYHEKGRFPDQMEFDQLELVTTGNHVMKTHYHNDMVNPKIEMTIAGFPDGENIIAWQWMEGWDPTGIKRWWWSCKVMDNGATTIQTKYLPSPCKN